MSNETVAFVLWLFAAVSAAGAVLAWLTIGDLEDDERASAVHHLVVASCAALVVGAIKLGSQALYVASGGAPSTYALSAWILVPASDGVDLAATGLLIGVIIGSVLFVRHHEVRGHGHGRRRDRQAPG